MIKKLLIFKHKRYFDEKKHWHLLFEISKNCNLKCEMSVKHKIFVKIAKKCHNLMTIACIQGDSRTV